MKGASMSAEAVVAIESLDDPALAALFARGDAAAVRLVTQRNNQRLYRTAWSILHDRSEAEDAVQEAYIKAFRAAGGFTGASSLSTWLTRIAVNEALVRRRAALRRRRRFDTDSVAVLEDHREKAMAQDPADRSPETALMRAEVARMLEGAVARLPDAFRPVFVLREIEGLSVAETAEALGLEPATVKTRLLRARRRLQEELDPELAAALAQTAAFAGADCERLTERVLARLAAMGREPDEA